MAKFEIQLPEGLIEGLENLAQDLPEIQKDILEAAAEPAEPILRASLASVIPRGPYHGDRSTGELVGSVGTSPVKPRRSDGYDIAVGFNEPRSGGQSAPKVMKVGKRGRIIAGRGYYKLSNAMLANLEEYGTHKYNRPPHVFFKAAKIKTERASADAAKRKFEERISEVFK